MEDHEHEYASDKNEEEHEHGKMMRVGESEGEEKCQSEEERILFADTSKEEKENDRNEEISKGIADDAT
jgi:hypothetical protein